MLSRSVCVSFYPGKRSPTIEEVKEEFQTYGQVQELVPDTVAFRDNFFVIFETEQAALRCYKERGILYDKYNYIVELKGEDNGIIRSVRADPDRPSLMDLNDDCLLHLMDYLKNEKSIQFINARFRRLYISSLKDRRISFDGCYSYECLSRLYHSGDRVTHLYITFKSDLPECKVYDFVFSCCRNLLYLNVNKSGCYHRIKLPKLLKEISSSVTEMDMCMVESNAINAILSHSALKLQKLSVMSGFTLYPEIGPVLSTLTALLFPEVPLDVGQVLRDIPQLQVLACTLKRTQSITPANNNLQELYVRFVYMMEGRVKDLIKIRKSCMQLRHLRVEGENLLKCDIRQFLPLDGFHLSLERKKLKMDENDLAQLALLKDELKVLILTDCYMDDKEKYASILSQFKKLKIISWDESHGDIDMFLKNRPANVPLKIIADFEPSQEQRMLSPSCEWILNSFPFSAFENVFESFSIYKKIESDYYEEDQCLPDFDDGDSDSNDSDGNGHSDDSDGNGHSDDSDGNGPSDDSDGDGHSDDSDGDGHSDDSNSDF